MIDLLIQRTGVADQLKRHGKGWVPWAGSLSTKKGSPDLPLERFLRSRMSLQVKLISQESMIFDVFDFSLFVHNCIYNSPHLKERQPNIIVLQCDGLIKMVIFTI